MKKQVNNLIFSLLIFVVPIFTIGCVNNSENQKKYGNILGNLFNLGDVVQDEDNIFYIDYSQNKPVLYKAELDGSNKKLIRSDYYKCLNVDESSLYGVNENAYICKMNKAGEELTQISNRKVRFFILYENRIYAISMDNDSKGHLFSMEMDGTNIKELRQENINNLYIINDKLYISWFNKITQKEIIETMNLDGSDNMIILEADSSISNLFVYNNYLIYTSKSMQELSIYDMNKKSNVEVITGFFSPSTFNMQNNLLYYSNLSENVFVCMDLKKGKIVKKVNISYNFFTYIINDKIFYSNDDGNYFYFDWDEDRNNDQPF